MNEKEALQEIRKIGIIGIHEHCREWGEKGTIDEALRIAEKMGFETICDMPNNIPPTISEEAFLDRLKTTQKSKHKKVKYMAWIGLTADPKQIAEAVELWEKYPEIIGLKMFAGKSTRSLAVITEDEQRIVYQTLTKFDYNGTIAVHCEEEKHINESLYDPNKPWTHALARPEIAEVSSVCQQIRLAENSGFPGHLHICHVSSHESVNMINASKKKKMRISCGVTPQALLYSIEQMKKMGKIKSLFLKCNPPIRTEFSKRLLIAALYSGKIDLIETDHAPHTVKDKLNNASGVMSMLLLPKLYVELKKQGFHEREIKNLLCENALRIFTKIRT